MVYLQSDPKIVNLHSIIVMFYSLNPLKMDFMKELLIGPLVIVNKCKHSIY